MTGNWGAIIPRWKHRKTLMVIQNDWTPQYPAIYVAKCNLGKVILQANAVSGLLLRHTWSVGWLQEPFAYLVPYVESHAGIFELIFADLLLKRIFADSGSQPFPPLLCIGKYGFRWVFSTEYFHCDSASWWMHAGVVPARRFAMDTSLLCLMHSGSCPTSTAPVPKLIYWRWV